MGFEGMTGTQIVVHDTPIKAAGEQHADALELQHAGDLAFQARVEVAEGTPGTCPDERPRIGLASGEAIIEPRESVFGGPVVYGLVVSELSGRFDGSTLDAEGRATEVDFVLGAAGIVSGGHEACAANASMNPVFGIIADNPEAMHEYAASDKSDLGSDYDPEVMDEVVGRAATTRDGGVYATWDETVLPTVLGDRAGHAIERLAPVPHEGRFLVRNKQAGSTVHQTTLYAELPGGAFSYDDQYAGKIERAVVTGPDPQRAELLARHAREAHIKAIAMALPNPELNQIDLN